MKPYVYIFNDLSENNNFRCKQKVENMSTVQVLCPNGRRQNVKVTPNTKLLQVNKTP